MPERPNDRPAHQDIPAICAKLLTEKTLSPQERKELLIYIRTLEDMYRTHIETISALQNGNPGCDADEGCDCDQDDMPGDDSVPPLPYTGSQSNPFTRH